ncbi:MAG: hypothetical protein QNJ13_00645 [Paracoccaceae bacterium]|nr:hypothetical protein [Paracoccaceae bacterium]
MSMQRFALIALCFSIAAGVALALGGATVGGAVLGALGVLVVLQVGYFLFLIVKAAMAPRNGDG